MELSKTKALGFITSSEMKTQNDKCNDLTEDNSLVNHCDGYCILKDHVKKGNFYEQAKSGKSLWTFLSSDKEFCKEINKDVSKTASFEAITTTKGLSSWRQAFGKCKSHAEPWILNQMLRYLIKHSCMVNDVDFVYLHTVYSPCNCCHDVLLKFSRFQYT